MLHRRRIAVVTGDAVGIEPDDFGARIAFVDYDGKSAYENFKTNPPETKSEETEFMKQNATRMVRGIQAQGNHVRFIREKR